MSGKIGGGLRDAVTTALDVLGLLIVAAGLFALLHQVIGPPAAIGSGLLILAVSGWWQRRTGDRVDL